MSIKDLFNKGTPKIQKSVSTDELVSTVESSDFLSAKQDQFDQFIPRIDFTTASNFAKFGSAELYYEKAFERIHNYYPYDGTLHEKIQFQNSSSFLDKHVFDNIYPRTNGYLNFNGNNQYISVFGGPHTASAGMSGKTLDSTFDLSMKYDEEKKRTSAFEFRGSDGITIEFWLKVPDITSVGQKALLHVSGAAGHHGEIKLYQQNGDVNLHLNSGSLASLNEFHSSFTGILSDLEWNHYAFTILSSSTDMVAKAYKNGQLFSQTNAQKNIPHILPVGSGLNARIASHYTAMNLFTGSMDEFRFWKEARTPEQIFNNWFIHIGGGTNKHDSNVNLGCYFKFNEGITENFNFDRIALDYSGRINNGIIERYLPAMRNTGSAIREKLNQAEFLDPIIYSSHPDVVSKKAQYKTSGSLADVQNTSMLYRYFPAWMQEDDEQNGKQLKYLSQVLGSYFDTLWHQINFIDNIHDHYYVKDNEKALPFSKKLLQNKGFSLPDLFTDATLLENLRQKDDNEVYEKEINEVRNTIYHNIYNNLDSIYKSKGTEESFRNFFRSLGIGQEVVKLKKYADDSTFVLRNNYEFKSYERKYLNFNVDGQTNAGIYQTSSANNSNIYLPGDTNYHGSFTLQSEVILPRKQREDEVGYIPFSHLSSSLVGYHSGQTYTHPASTDYGLQAFVVKSKPERSLRPDEKQRIKFVLSGSNVNLETDWYSGQYNNNKWSLAIRLKHANYPRTNITASVPDDYLLEFYGVEADGNTKRNYFLLSTSSVGQSYYSSDKIFYAGAHRTNFTGSILHYSDVKLGYVRYWHSLLSNDAIDQHAFDSETFGINEPFEQDLINTYPVEIPREKTLAFHWAFNDLTSSDASGQLLISDLSSGSVNNDYQPLSDTIQRYIQAKGDNFNVSSTKALEKTFLYSARKRLPDDLMSSDLTTIKTDETENFFVDDDVSDNFYSFEKSMWGAVSDEMMNIFSTALDINNLIGQPNQRYHHRYNLMDFLRNRFFDDVENEPDIERFTTFYRWIDDSISFALQQLIPASTRFSEKINNIIESHVLERNKYVHQIPITTNFESTEGSIKGIQELNYNWRFGHAPTDTTDESNHVLWQQDRKKKSGLRETLRVSRNNHSLQSAGLIRREIDGSTRLADSYAVRKFAKNYNFEIDAVSQNTIHGGTNFGRKKNLQLFHESIAPAGRIESVPQNVVTVGVGPGQGIVQETVNNDVSPRKKKYQLNAQIGNRAGEEYGHNILGDFVLPMNLMSGTINSGYNAVVEASYSSGVHITNLHNDIVGNYNETSIQGPFTEQHVGGLQYRHIDPNAGSDSSANRPEGWGLSIAEHPVDPSADGAFGFVGADYDSSGYPDSSSLKATRYRDEHAKRPVNIRNIKTVSGSFKAGNYTNEIQIFSVSPTFQKTWAVEAYDDPNVQILPTYISSALPQTTNYQTLMGVSTYSAGNVFGTHVNNRQSDGALLVAGSAGTFASGSFEITGATVSGTPSSGSFQVTGSPFVGALAKGSFQLTSSMVQGTSATGSFTMSGAFSPEVSASYGLTVIGRTILGTVASGSFEVSGAFVAVTPASATFDVSALPVGGERAYNIFDASYQTANDGHFTKLGRNSNANAVEIDYTNLVSSGNTPVYPVTFKKAAEVSGSNQYYSGSATFSNNQEWVLNFYVSASANAMNEDKKKYLYHARNSGNRNAIEIFFDEGAGSNARKLVVRRWANSGIDYNELKTNTQVCSDSGLPWTMITVTANGGVETSVYINATSSNTTPTATAGNSAFNSITIDEHYVMSDQGNNSQWNGVARISDFMMWNVNLTTVSSVRNDFVERLYHGGVREPRILSGSDLGWKYTFGDSGNSDPRVIVATYSSGSQLSGSQEIINSVGQFVNSCFAVSSSAPTYFSELKTAIENHNSDGTYFSVNYDEYATTASSTLTTFVDIPIFEEDGFSYGFKPGSLSATINAGDTLNFARFYVNSKQESDSSDYGITSSVDNGGKTGQSRSFISVASGSQSSAQQNELDAFDGTNITISGNVILFDDHASSITGSKVSTFSATGSSIQGSSTGLDARLKNTLTTVMTGSLIYETQDIAISFWHDPTGDAETIVELPASSQIALEISAVSDNTVLTVRDSDTHTRQFSFDLDDPNIGIPGGFNHFIWSYTNSNKQAKLYVNGRSRSVSINDTGGVFDGMNDNQWRGINIAGSQASNDSELRGRLTELAIWSGSIDLATAGEIYNDGRIKNLYEIPHDDDRALAHWYRLGAEAYLPSSGSNLGSVTEIKDVTSAVFPVDLTVQNGSVYTVASGIPTDTISNSTFWNNLSSSIEANVTGYDVSFATSATSASFTVTKETAGVSGNGEALSENSTLIANLVTSTTGGLDQSGVTDGAFITIDTIRFEADDDGTADVNKTVYYIQNTASSDAFWNALSQSIKDNTDFDDIEISGTGLTRTLSITSSIRGVVNNGVIGSVNGEFSLVNQTAGGVDDTGAVDGHRITLRPSSDNADTYAFIVDRDNDGSDTSNTRFIYSVQASNADWWNALSSSMEAEGFSVSYVADSPSAGTASFTINPPFTGSSGNSPRTNVPSGYTFVSSSTTSFAGGVDASGSVAGDTITISGSVFTLINTGTAGSNTVLVTGSGVTSESMFEDLRSKVEAATSYTVITESSGIPRLFQLSAPATGSGNNPSMQETGSTFTLVNAGTDGVNEVGAEAGDSITLGGSTFTIVSGAPGGSTQISFTGSSEAIRNSLSQSIKDNTVFDTIEIEDLGDGYHRFDLTSSVVGVSHNVAFSANSSGVRETFKSLTGATGGLDSHGIVDGDNLKFNNTRIFLTASAPGPDNPKSALYVITTGSSEEIWQSIESKIESNFVFNVVTSSALGMATFSITASVTGSSRNITLEETGSSFSSLVNFAGGTDETGIRDGDRLTFDGKLYHLTASAISDSSTQKYINTTGLTTTQIWSALKTKIETNSTDYTVTTSSVGSVALFQITASTTGSSFNSTLVRRFGPSEDRSASFISLSGVAGGQNVVDPVVAVDNVIAIPRTDLTGSERNISTRFSAPGGVEIQSIGYLDAYTSTYSVYNALGFRNLSVLGSGSGEEGTIRVDDHLGKRRGLKMLRALPMGQFGIDSEYGQVTADDYPSSGSFNKQHRNRSRAYQYSSEQLIITGSNHDNAFINTPIPRSEFQYSWIRSTISGSNWENGQRILGYAPRDGIVSSSIGYVEAIVFPSASSIIGS